MNSVQENEVRALVRAALLKLADSVTATFTRADLFGDGRDGYTRNTKILERLVAGGLIDVQYGKIGESAIYAGKNLVELRKAAGDDFELSRLIWPGRTPPKPMNMQPPHALSSLETTAPTAPITSNSSNEPTKDEVNGMILKMLAAIVENVIYLRERVDALDSVACSHCSNVTAHSGK